VLRILVTRPNCNSHRLKLFVLWFQLLFVIIKVTVIITPFSIVILVLSSRNLALLQNVTSLVIAVMNLILLAGIICNSFVLVLCLYHCGNQDSVSDNVR